MLNNLQQMRLKLLQKLKFKKTAQKNGDSIKYKTADQITKDSKNFQQNNSETVTNEHKKEIAKERYIFPEERQKIIDDLR